MRAARFALSLLYAGVCLAADPQPMDVKFKVRGYFIVGPTQTLRRPAPAGTLSLTATPQQSAVRVVLANTTRATASFEAQDNRINVVREALDADGRWKPIEYLPNSWCGNSYHSLELPPNRYWSFAAPHYLGPFKTRMRFVLEQKGLRLVSNEFAGSIHREQFTKKQGHTPTNLMDPYDE